MMFCCCYCNNYHENSLSLKILKGRKIFVFSFVFALNHLTPHSFSLLEAEGKLTEYEKNINYTVLIILSNT